MKSASFFALMCLLQSYKCSNDDSPITDTLFLSLLTVFMLVRIAQLSIVFDDDTTMYGSPSVDPVAVLEHNASSPIDNTLYVPSSKPGFRVPQVLGNTFPSS